MPREKPCRTPLGKAQGAQKLCTASDRQWQQVGTTVVLPLFERHKEFQIRLGGLL